MEVRQPRRSIIRVMLTGVVDEQALKIKQEIEKLVKDIEQVDVELTILGR